ncbi:[Fe-S]-binding protein [Cephaloticoccus primus]|uniref:[Fe-S]-binding protein n=1 Tax=Cephaloticoccus primus TaxID=1548207 RepID=A0A139SHU2_9BACT|nr:class I ribonucleotide reductase maintenance protein YfaE [Cephaloticoccus primus]KXU34145.1 [Fe-S]-binding protein [Cephaloticoccus primus]
MRITTPDRHFMLRPGESLLEGLERTGHEVEYQCLSGYCGVCRLPLIEGRVSYARPPLAYLHPGELLACCCQVEGPITVDCALRPDRQLDLNRDDQQLDLFEEAPNE